MRVAISSSVNDLYTFAPWIEAKISAPNVDFSFANQQELNTAVISQDIDVAKISFAILPQIEDHYELIPHGACLVSKSGPLLAGSYPAKGTKLGIPGRSTTAYLVFREIYPNCEAEECLLDDSVITSALKSGEIDSGLFIHTSTKDLILQGINVRTDLAKSWQEKFGLLLPLGGFVIKKDLEPEIRLQAKNAVKASLNYARINHDWAVNFCVEKSSQDRSSVLSFLEDWVGEEANELSPAGKRAIAKLCNLAKKK